MKSVNTPNEILMITSYLPRECGIATYSKDLINALSQRISNSFSVSVCALEKVKAERNASEWKNVAAKHACILQKYLPERPLALKFHQIPSKPIYSLAN